jgi:hypothetical protein
LEKIEKLNLNFLRIKIKYYIFIMKDIEIIEELEKLFPGDFLNLYFVYKGVKRGYYNLRNNKNSQNKIIKLCEKLKLNYLFIKDNRFDDSYFIFISKNKIKEPDYYIKNNEKNDKNIGLFIGFPKKCVDNFKSKKNKFIHNICVELRLKDKILSEDIIVFACNKRMIFYLKNMKNKIKKVIEKNLLSDIIDYEITAEIREEI